MKLITLVSLAFSLLVINYLFRKTLESIKRKNIVLDYLRRYLPVVELTAWSIFGVWILNLLFVGSKYNLYLNFLLFILIFIFAGWYFLRDFIAGVQIKSRFNLAKGQRFLAAQADGEIVRLGILTMTIKMSTGGDLIIPYAKLNQDTIQLNFHEKSETETRFTLELNKKINEKEMVRTMEELIINSAWCSHKSMPKVIMLAEEDGKRQYEITCQPTVNDGAKRIKALLQQTFDKG
jgi:hypothetical protein